MKSRWLWVRELELKDKVNLLCPSPFVRDGLLYVFYARQARTNQAAFLECVQFDSNLKVTNLAMAYSSCPNHLEGMGNLPTSIYLSEEGSVNLMCAEFSKSVVHKHRLLTHSHVIELASEKVIIGKPQRLNFIDYESEIFHTIAGMSFWAGSFYFAKGKQWCRDGESCVPQTLIYKVSQDKQIEILLQLEDEEDVLAYARPSFFKYKSHLYMAYSVRLRGNRYGSRLIRIGDHEPIRIEQSFLVDKTSFDQDNLAYGYPFFWKNSLWTFGTFDYRGSSGFSLFRLGEEIE